MKKQSLLIVAAVMLFSAAAIFSTETRVQTLGGNLFIEDINNIVFCPALLPVYTNTFLLEVGSSASAAPAGQWGGVIFSPTGTLALGVFLERDEYPMANVYGRLLVNQPQNPIELAGAADLGMMKVGASLYFARTSAQNITLDTNWQMFPVVDSTVRTTIVVDTNTTKSMVLGGRLGVSFGDPKALKADGWIGATRNSYNNITRNDVTDLLATPVTVTSTVTQTDLSGSYTIDAGGRVTTRALSEKFSHGGFLDAHYTPYTSTTVNNLGTSQFAVSLVDLELGYIGELNFTEISALFLGLGLRYDRVAINPTPVLATRAPGEALDKTGTLVFPVIRLGFEQLLKEKWVLRAGMQKYFGSSTRTREWYRNYQEINTQAPSPAANLVTLGVGYKSQRVVVDASLSEEVFFDGPYFISGNTLAGGLFGKLSATVFFGSVNTYSTPTPATTTTPAF